MSNEKSTKKQAEKRAETEQSFFFPTYGRSVVAKSRDEALKTVEAQANS